MPPEFPVGPFVPEPHATAARRAELIAHIAALPVELRDAVRGLTDEQLDTKYKNWTLRQIVHHVADSHINSYVRFRWALTEERPTIKAYLEAEWVQLPDARTGPVELSLALADALHARWVVLLEALTDADFARAFVHPQSGATVTLSEALSYYAWHGRHHAGQIAWLRAARGW
jgi:uncharacterized damage-inducible protein DinB